MHIQHNQRIDRNNPHDLSLQSKNLYHNAIMDETRENPALVKRGMHICL
jgi:hypothetical protein